MDYFLRADLNLLPSLAALLDERQISRAAIRVGVSQPAMSRILQRLRDVIGDDHRGPAAECRLESPGGTAEGDGARARLATTGVRPRLPGEDVGQAEQELPQTALLLPGEPGQSGIVGPPLHDGERLQLLDGTERTLVADDLVVADEVKALGLAGVMG